MSRQIIFNFSLDKRKNPCYNTWVAGGIPAQRPVDNLWISAYVWSRLASFRYCTALALRAWDFVSILHCSARSAPVNENHSHLEIVTRLSQKGYWQNPFVPLNLHSKFKGVSILFSKTKKKSQSFNWLFKESQIFIFIEILWLVRYNLPSLRKFARLSLC